MALLIAFFITFATLVCVLRQIIKLRQIYTSSDATEKKNPHEIITRQNGLRESSHQKAENLMFSFSFNNISPLAVGVLQLLMKVTANVVLGK